MPNWCENNLTVTGTKESLDKWRIALSNDDSMNPLLKFNKLIPLPEEEKDNWYDWRVQNWGTKWDIVGDDEPGEEPYDSNDDSYGYSFDTAWGPPIELFENIMVDFPGVRFELAYVEPGMCFAGHLIIDNGEVISHDQYNEPADVNWFCNDFFGYEIWTDDELAEMEEED
jgi:hypothetical protein